MMTTKKMNKIIEKLDLFTKILFGSMILCMFLYVVFSTNLLWIFVWITCILCCVTNSTGYVLDEIKIFLVKDEEKEYIININKENYHVRRKEN